MFDAIAMGRQQLSDRNARCLEQRLRIPHEVFPAVDLAGYVDRSGAFAFVFPEKDGNGKTIGYTRRFEDGSKRNTGSRGLTIPTGWTPDPGEPLLLVEGASDVLACVAMDLRALGRPSNTGGITHLVTLLSDTFSNPNNPIVVVGENDRKEVTGQWPGKDGAEKTAQKLANALGRVVLVAFPPAGIKDVRDYFTAAATTPAGDVRIKETEAAAVGRDLLRHLLATAVEFRPHSSAAAASKVQPITNRWWSECPHIPGAAGGDGASESAAPVATWCPTPKGVFLRHLTKNLDRVQYFDCKRLTCPTCGPKRREVWCATVRYHLTTHAETHGESTEVYGFLCEAGRQWNAVHRRIRQAGGEYFRVNLNGEGLLLVVSTVAPGAQVPERHGRPLTCRQAIDKACGAIRQLPKIDTPKTFTTSRGWRVLDAVPSRDPQWKRMHAVSTEPETVESILRHRCASFSNIGSKPNGQPWAWFGLQWGRGGMTADADHVQKEVDAGMILTTDEEWAGGRSEWSAWETKDMAPRDQRTTGPPGQPGPPDEHATATGTGAKDFIPW